LAEGRCRSASGRKRAVSGRGRRQRQFLSEASRVQHWQRTAIVVGSPIVGERVDPRGAAQRLLDSSNIARTVSTFNGQFLFLLHDKSHRSLTLISDRQTGMPFYYADLGGCVAGSFLYSDLVRHVRRSGALQFVPEHLFEFLWLQRLLMDKTHDERCRFLPSASIVTFDASGMRMERYWRPHFGANNARSTRAAAHDMASLMRRAMARRMSDGKRYGLFLSGGHDSRTILAAAPTPPVCFTVGYSDNYEVGCARELAALSGARFEFLPLAANHLDRYADDASDLCGGLYSIDHALFLGQNEKVAAAADVVFHGHGIDYMYQGMYLPSRYLSALGSPTFFRKLAPYSSDIGKQFLNEIPYRLKGVDLMSLVRAEWRERLGTHLRDAAAAVVGDSRDVARSNADRWEYFQIHALARHFSWPNIGSKMVGVEQRIPSFDVDLFDFYLSLTPSQRVTGSVLRHAQLLLNRALALVPTVIGASRRPIRPRPKLRGWLAARHCVT
jgi:asparagine synthetase B (glutamine-hydrolysing)